MIKVGSMEEQTIAKCIEEGLSFTQTTAFVNDWRARNLGPGHVKAITRSAVVGHYKRMPKIITPVGKRAQGSSDEDSVWDKAWYGWVVQILICLGLLDNLE